MATAIEQSIDGNGFGAISTFFQGLVPLDNIVGFKYCLGKVPEYLYSSSNSVIRDRLYDRFISGIYLNSPYYNEIISPMENEGFFRLSDLGNIGDSNSEYYQEFYHHKGISDEGLFHFTESGGSLVVVLERAASSPAFRMEELDTIRDTMPIVRALLKKQLKKELSQRSIHDNVVRLIDTCGLSKREAEVALLILDGCSSKQAANLLGISPHTERVHRKRLYQRLGVKSHGELIALLLSKSSG